MLRRPTDRFSPEKIYQTMTAFAVRFRLYRRRRNKLTEISSRKIRGIMKDIANEALAWLWKTALAATVCAGAFSQPGLAQVPPASILRIDTTNLVLYYEDTPDPSKYATDPNVTTPNPPRNFS